MKGMVAVIGALFSLFFANHSEAKECNGSWRVNVDANSPLSRTHDDSLWLKAQLSLSDTLAECVMGVGFTAKSTASLVLASGNDSIKTELYDFQSDVLIPQNGDRTYIPVSKARETTFWIKLLNANFSDAGTYRAKWDAELALNQTHNAKLTKKVSFTFKINPMVGLAVDANEPWLKGGKGHYHFDMGELFSGKTRSIQMKLRSNAAVRLSVSSDHGALIHTEYHEQRIPYQVSLNRLPAFQPSPSEQQFQLGQQRANAIRTVPLSVQVPYVPKGALAGEYQDILTIQVDAY
ncbi:hypothetical protein N9R79_04375 [Vibrio sp.]|nr:hypothetical protein [Vibrio sp.]